MLKRKEREFPAHKSRTAAIIAAAGSGSRMKSDQNKQFLMLGGAPVLAHAVSAFEEAGSIDEIIIVTRERDILLARDLVEEYEFSKVSCIIAGGATRQESVFKGLKAVSEGTSVVAIHDGARPFISPEKIDEAVWLASVCGAAAVGVRVKDTIKVADEDNIITRTLDRAGLWQIQTPQVFKYDIILRAHTENVGVNATDDCALAESTGAKVTILEGSYSNIKITTREDIAVGEAILEES